MNRLARWTLATCLALPALGTASADDEKSCETVVPLSFTKEEMAQAEFEPGGIKPFLLGLFAGPRIALEWNDGRGVRTIELFRSVPYLGNFVGLFLCVEALSGYRMTAVAGETGIDDWRRKLYFQRIHNAESVGDFKQAAHLRECSPFDTYNNPANPEAVKPDESRGFGKWKSGLSGLFIDNRVGLEREESRGIRAIEYWSILRIPSIFPAIDAYQGKTMSEVVREDGLDTEWLESNRAAKRKNDEVSE